MLNVPLDTINCTGTDNNQKNKIQNTKNTKITQNKTQKPKPGLVAATVTGLRHPA